ncbi:uncharacterized protein LOC119641247 [Glossina fuscipes]|uniref:Uncharacterized protein LOC119641247 n=1 Tax=Glossina fuscipes TaxID=7396 RepID=A0A9C5Z5S9_9MUSC|nr:uncharacterized protein LOC119641247 [Glossina fuscipes]
MPSFSDIKIKVELFASIAYICVRIVYMYAHYSSGCIIIESKYPRKPNVSTPTATTRTTSAVAKAMLMVPIPFAQRIHLTYFQYHWSINTKRTKHKSYGPPNIIYTHAVYISLICVSCLCINVSMYCIVEISACCVCNTENPCTCRNIEEILAAK